MSLKYCALTVRQQRCKIISFILGAMVAFLGILFVCLINTPLAFASSLVNDSSSESSNHIEISEPISSSRVGGGSSTGGASSGSSGGSLASPNTFEVKKVWDDGDDKYNTRPNEIKLSIEYKRIKTEEGKEPQESEWKPLNQEAYDGDDFKEWRKEWSENPFSNKLDYSNFTLSEENQWFKRIALPGDVSPESGNNKSVSIKYQYRLTELTKHKAYDFLNISAKTISPEVKPIPGGGIGPEVVITDDNTSVTPVVNSTIDEGSTGSEPSLTLPVDIIPGKGPSTFEVTVTNRLKTLDIPVEKTWLGENGKEEMRPASVTVHLLQNGKKIKDITLHKDTNWKYTFEKLPMYDKDEKEFNYSIVEDEVPHYSTSIKAKNEKDYSKGFVITNTFTSEKTELIDIEGHKIWNDKNNAYGIRPQTITVKLFADGEFLTSKQVSAKDNWTYKFEKLQKYKNKKLITYTIKEQQVKGYTSEVRGYDIINSYTPPEEPPYNPPYQPPYDPPYQPPYEPALTITKTPQSSALPKTDDVQSIAAILVIVGLLSLGGAYVAKCKQA